MEERKKYLHSAWFTASYFYPKGGKKEQNPLASSNILAKIVFMNWKFPMPFCPIMNPLKKNKLSQETV